MYHFKVDADKLNEEDFIKYVGWLNYALREVNGK